MKKIILSLVAMVVFFCSCLSFGSMGNQSSHEGTGMSGMDYNKLIIGQWVMDNNEKVEIFDFKPGTDVQVRSINKRGRETYNEIWKYQIEGNYITFLNRSGEGRMEIKFNTENEFILNMKLGRINIAFLYKRFDTQPNENITEELVTLERAGNIEIALQNSAKKIITSLERGKNIAISGISAEDMQQSDFLLEELEVILLDAGISLVDRRQLNIIRQEQNLQLSGEVDDNEIVSIGKFAGANYIITGSVNGLDATRRLRLRLLDIETARVIAAASERF